MAPARTRHCATHNFRLNVSLHFPLWHVTYESLIEDLQSSGVVCEISAVTQPAKGLIAVGDVFDRRLAARLPQGIDGFGECGEFHTLAKIWQQHES